MRLSKHHYAVELARRGNQVLFVEPPDAGAPDDVHVVPLPEAPRLSLVCQRPWAPYRARFHARPLFDWLTRRRIRALRDRLGPWDVVWCFEMNLYADLRWFGARYNIFHPVDQLEGSSNRRVAEGADLVLTVAQEIADRLTLARAPKVVLGHGLADAFVEAAREGNSWSADDNRPVRVGYVGNLLRPSVDRAAFRRLVDEHPLVEFHIWGPRTAAECNVEADTSPAVLAFLSHVQSARHVVMHGSVPPAEVARGLGGMDALVLCFDLDRDPNRGANYHKVLEYLSSGRVVVSSWISAYADKPDLIRMAREPGNADLPAIFDDTIAHLRIHNSEERRAARTRFAVAHSYRAQVDRIEQLMPVHV